MLTWSEEMQISAAMRELLLRMTHHGHQRNEWLKSSFDEMYRKLSGGDQQLVATEMAGVDSFTHTAWTLVFEMIETGFAVHESYQRLIAGLTPLFESVGLNCDPNRGWINLRELKALEPGEQEAFIQVVFA
jgi:hypothetical protein